MHPHRWMALVLVVATCRMRIIWIMQEQAERLGQLIQGFLDEFLAAVPRGKFARPEIASQWVNEVLASAKRSEAGNIYAPDQYTLSLHPRDYEALTKLDHISQTKLSTALRLALETAQLSLTREPHITLATDPTLPRGEVRVIAWHSSDPVIEGERVAQTEEEEATGGVFHHRWEPALPLGTDTAWQRKGSTPSPPRRTADRPSGC